MNNLCGQARLQADKTDAEHSSVGAVFNRAYLRRCICVNL